MAFSNDINLITVSGRVTLQPQFRYLPSGDLATTLRIANNRRFTNRRTGEIQQAVEYFNVALTGRLAELAERSVNVGTQLLIAGRMQTRSWNAPDQTRRYFTEIVPFFFQIDYPPRMAPVDEAEVELAEDDRWEEQVAAEQEAFGTALAAALIGGAAGGEAVADAMIKQALPEAAEEVELPPVTKTTGRRRTAKAAA